MHQCKICFATFTRSYDLKRHVHTVHGDSQYQCEFCVSSFTRSDDLKRHVHTVHGVPQYRCGFCDSSFTRVESYNQHLKNRESCPHRNLTCCGKRKLSSHMKIIHREKLYTLPSRMQDRERPPKHPLTLAMDTSHIQPTTVQKKCNHNFIDSDGHYHTQDNLREDIPDNIFINSVTTTGNNLF